MILDALVRYPIPIPAYEKILDHRDLYHGQAPTMEHIVADLILAKHEDLNIVDQEIGHGTQSHKEQVLVSMWTTAYLCGTVSMMPHWTISGLNTVISIPSF